MGLFNKKITIKQASDCITDIGKDPNNTEEHIIFLRANETKTAFVMQDGCISGALHMLPRMLVEACKNDPDFTKALITASESLKFGMPGMQEFADHLNANKPEKPVQTGRRALDAGTPINDITDAIKNKFPGAEVMSIDLTKMDDMAPEDFQALVDKIYKSARRNNGSGPSKDSDSK